MFQLIITLCESANYGSAFEFIKTSVEHDTYRQIPTATELRVNAVQASLTDFTNNAADYNCVEVEVRRLSKAEWFATVSRTVGVLVRSASN